MVLTATRLTYQDYLSMDGDERYELIDGELIMVGAPNFAHQRVIILLGSGMHIFVDERDLGWVLSAPFDVLLSDTDVVQPDLLFVSKEREEIATPAYIRGAPDLVVEILSPSSTSRDWRDKFELYSKHGVKEYWIVDPANRVVWLMLLRGGALEIAGTYGIGDTVSSTVLAGFSVKVDDIF